MFSDFTQFSYQVYTLCCSYTCIENVYVLNVRLIALCRGTILSLVSSSLLAAFNLSHCSACHNTRVSSSANQKPVSSLGSANQKLVSSLGSANQKPVSSLSSANQKPLPSINQSEVSFQALPQPIRQRY